MTEPATSSQTDTELQAALTGLMQLAGLQPEGPVSGTDVQEAVDKVKQMLAHLKKAAAGGGAGSTDSGGGPAAMASGKRYKNVLVAGQLGIIVHQLRQAITKQGGEVTIAKDMDEAISGYQKQDYSLVIIDLYMPTEREGLIVLEEIKRISVVCHINTQIIVLAPMSKDKQIQDRCKSKGATFFLEKAEKWHETILKFYSGEITAEQFEQSQ